MSSHCPGVKLRGETGGNAGAVSSVVEEDGKERVSPWREGPLGHSWAEGWLLWQWPGIVK